MFKIYANKRAQIFSFLVIVLVLTILGSVDAFAQKETSYLLFGMPQQTFMYGKSDSKNAAEIAKIFLPDEPRKINKLPSYNFAFGFFAIKSYSKRVAVRFGFFC